MAASTIGYIGLGTMGLPMAQNIAAAGHPVIVHDQSAANLAAVTGRTGFSIADSGRAVAERCDVVCLCLPDARAARQVLLGADGVATGARAGLLVCDNSSIDRSTALDFHQALQRRGISYLECPVLGGREQAQSGELFAVVSGDADCYRTMESLIRVISRDHRFVGAAGTASLFKSVQNGLGLVQWAGIAEALGILAAAGADLNLWYEVVTEGHGMADTPLFRAMARKIIDEDNDFRAYLRIGAKDIELASAQARALRLDAATFEAANGLFREALALGLGEQDIAQIARVIEARFATTIGSGPDRSA